MNTDVLEELGLTPKEIKIYLALLELGNASAKEILQKSKSQNSSLHFCLNNLIEKGLISFIYEGKGRIYQANDPEQFNRYIEEKQKRFQALLPELKSKQYFAKKQESAKIYKGKRGISEIYYQLINLNAKEYNTFGGGKHCVEKMSDTWWLNLHNKRLENKLPARQIFDDSVKVLGSKIQKNKLTKIKYLPKEFATFQETVIVGDYVAINVFTEEPYGFLIKDENVAKSYKQYFEMLWKIAK